MSLPTNLVIVTFYMSLSQGMVFHQTTYFFIVLVCIHYFRDIPFKPLVDSTVNLNSIPLFRIVCLIFTFYINDDTSINQCCFLQLDSTRSTLHSDLLYVLFVQPPTL